MAKKSKAELIEEANDLGLDVDPDQSYSEILGTVREGRGDDEDSAEEDQELVEVESPPEPAPVPATRANPPSPRIRYLFDTLGNPVKR